MILNRLLKPAGENRDQPVIGFDQWAQMVSQFGWNGMQYTTPETPQEQVSNVYQELAALAYQQDGIVFACMAVRQMLFRQMRFQFRRPRDGASGALFGDTSLRPLERPWTGGTTSDLLSRAIVHHDLGGNAFFVRTRFGMNLMRPDWVDMVIGSNLPDISAAAWDMDAEVIGYIYHPGGRYSGQDPVTYLSDEVAHWAMHPDPLAQFRGMSWLTPVVREIMSDKAATDHKLRFFEKAATPNLHVKVDTDDLAKYEQYIELFKRQKEGVANAYATMFTARGVDVTAIGKDMQQMDFKSVQGAGEVRIAAAAGVPPVIVGLSEGLSGSSLNAGNYTAARRRLADGTIIPMWQNLCGTLDNLFASVNGGRLWFDPSDVAFMKEDQQDAAEIQSVKASSLNTLITAGYTPESAVKAIVADDFTLLDHTGRFSVQLQPQDTGNATDPASPDNPAPTASTPSTPAVNGANGRRGDEADYLLRELLLDIQRQAQSAQPHVFNITTPPTTVEIGPGAIQSHVSLELPAGEGSRTEFAEGAFTSHVTVEPSTTAFHEGAIRVDPADVTVGDVSVTVEPAPTTIEAGAVQSSVNVVPPPPAEVNVRVDAPPPAEVNVTVDPPSVTLERGAVEVSVDVEPARTEIAEGAFQTSVTVEQPDIQVDVQPADVRTEIAEGAVQVTVEPGDVHVETPETNISIETRAADQPAPNVTVNVEPTPVEITNQVDVKQPNKTVTFDRDADGNIIEATTEDTPSEDL